MTWPDGSWLFSRLVGNPITRRLATVLLALTALGFFAGGLGLFLHQTWWRPVAVGAAVLSSVIFLLFWDGKFRALSDQGWIGVLIDLALFGIVLVLKWSP
jgi:hypothetical protein